MTPNTIGVWSFDAIADSVCAELERRDLALRQEQAVRGLDSLDELEMHPIVASSLIESGFGVLREQPYPHEWQAKSTASSDPDESLPGHRDRMRCDFVLTEHPSQRLDDSWTDARNKQARRRQAKGTLFERLADAPVAPVHEPGRVPPEDVLWLELKAVTQFNCASGAAGPNRSYASQLIRGPLADLTKLADDSRIQHAAVMIIAFTADAAIAAHDLTVLAHKCLDKDLPVQSPATRSFSIPDRMGNGACTICVVGMRKLI